MREPQERAGHNDERDEVTCDSCIRVISSVQLHSPFLPSDDSNYDNDDYSIQ